MHNNLVRPMFLSLLVVVASACVSISPVSRVGAVLPPATAIPSHEPTPTAIAVVPDPTDTPAPTEATRPPSPPSSDTLQTTPPPTTPQPSPDATTDPTPTPTDAPSTANPNDPACFDDAFELEDFAWNKPYEWYFNAASTPNRYDVDEVLAVIERSIENVLTERNDCGRPDRVFAEATYLGTITNELCTSPGDETNVIGFGPPSADLSEDTIAYTCPYTFAGTARLAEADVVIDEDIDWAISLDDCRSQELLEPTVTHEIGHVFGLGHVSERQHGALTMSTRSDGPCDNGSSTLGLGDMLALESLYPRP